MKRKFIDLHTHSTCSDGTLSPRQLVRYAAERDLAAIALTDHDSIDGVEEAIDEGKKVGVEVVPALELSAKSDTEMHIVGLFVDIGSGSLASALEKSKKVRCEREEETCRLLNSFGFDITMEEVYAAAGGGILCRAHFARVLTEKGYFTSPKEAFDKYLGVGCPAYSGLQGLSDEECIDVIRSAGGLSVAAHIHHLKMDDDALFAYLSRMKDAGLDGIEGFYTEYTPEMQEKYLGFAEKLGLLVSGGTDFHGKNKPHIEIGRGLGNLEIGYRLLEKMKERRAR